MKEYKVDKISNIKDEIQNTINEDNSVLIIGAAEKLGLLCCYEVRQNIGKKGKIIGLVENEKQAIELIENKLVDKVIVVDIENSSEVFTKVLRYNNNKEVDICINCIDSSNPDISSIFPIKNNGKLISIKV